VIAEFEGAEIDYAELERRVLAGRTEPDNPLQTGPDAFIDLTPPTVHFNHSCSPNATAAGTKELRSLVNIPKASEITFDYSLTVSRRSYWTMNCNCGSPACRSILGNWRSIPLFRVRRFYAQNLLQDHIRAEYEQKHETAKMEP
jgi:hypothetical protein